MMKIFVIIVNLLFSTVLCAQNKAIRTFWVVDSVNREGIPYINVSYGNNSGCYTKEDGSLEVESNRVRTLFLSHISYQDKEVSISQLNSDTILLNPKSVNLAEVVVTPIKGKAKKEIIGLINHKQKHFYGALNGCFVALYIPYKKEWITPPLISSIVMKL